MYFKLNKLYPTHIFVTESKNLAKAVKIQINTFFWISKKRNWGKEDLSSGTTAGAYVMFYVFSGNKSGNPQGVSYCNPGLG